MNTAINFHRSASEESLFEEEERPRRNWYHRTRNLGRHANKLVIIGLLLLFVIVYFWQFMFFTVQSGEVGVLYLLFGGGTQTDRVLGEGMKVIAPWDKLYIYNVRVQEVKHEMQALTAEGLMVTLEVSIRYHPELELVGLLHQRVGPDYTDRIVIPEVESALREKVGSSNITEVYRMQRSLLQEVAIEGFENVSRKYIRIDELILRSVKLPDAVRIEIENKMTQQEVARSYEYKLEIARREAERLLLESNGRKAYNDTLQSSLTPELLRWEGIEATRQLAESPNAKTVIIGDKSGLPLILGDTSAAPK